MVRDKHQKGQSTGSVVQDSMEGRDILAVAGTQDIPLIHPVGGAYSRYALISPRQ